MTDRMPKWLNDVDCDPRNHHFVEVKQLPAPGHGSQIVRLAALCTRGWQSGEHQTYLGASTRWAEERAQHQFEKAGIRHIGALAASSP